MLDWMLSNYQQTQIYKLCLLGAALAAYGVYIAVKRKRN